MLKFIYRLLGFAEETVVDVVSELSSMVTRLESLKVVHDAAVKVKEAEIAAHKTELAAATKIAEKLKEFIV